MRLLVKKKEDTKEQVQDTKIPQSVPVVDSSEIVKKLQLQEAKKKKEETEEQKLEREVKQVIKTVGKRCGCW